MEGTREEDMADGDMENMKSFGSRRGCSGSEQVYLEKCQFKLVYVGVCASVCGIHRPSLL